MHSLAGFVLALVAGATVAAAAAWLRSRRTLSGLQRFRTALDACTDAVYLIDRQTLTIVDATAAAVARSGLTRQQLLGSRPAAPPGTVCTDLAACCDEVIAAGESGLRAEMHCREAGHDRWEELHRHALQIAGRWLIVATCRDITQRKQAELGALRI